MSSKIYYPVEVDQLEYEKMKADKERLDYLDSLIGSYTGKVILRWSETGRGWRLHETSSIDSYKTVREAIDNFRREEGD